LHISEAKQKPSLYSSHDLDEELRIYVQSLLIDYIVKEHKVGYTLEAIKAALINFGHDPKIVDEAILIIEKGRVVDYRAADAVFKFPQAVVASLSLFLVFSFLVFLSISTDTSIITILPNFLPLFLSYCMVNAAFFFLPNTKLLVMLPLAAVIIAVGIFIVGIQYGMLGKAPGSDILLILNALGALLSAAIVCAFSKKGKEEIIVELKNKKQKKMHDAEEKLIEKRIQEPKIGEAVPKEPYQPSGKPIIPHEAQVSSQPPKNSMLQYLREEIDKKPVARQHSPAAVHPTSVKKPAALASYRVMPKSVDALPEKRQKEKKIVLKTLE